MTTEIDLDSLEVLFPLNRVEVFYSVKPTSVKALTDNIQELIDNLGNCFVASNILSICHILITNYLDLWEKQENPEDLGSLIQFLENNQQIIYYNPGDLLKGILLIVVNHPNFSSLAPRYCSLLLKEESSKCSEEQLLKLLKKDSNISETFVLKYLEQIEVIISVELFIFLLRRERSIIIVAIAKLQVETSVTSFIEATLGKEESEWIRIAILLRCPVVAVVDVKYLSCINDTTIAQKVDLRGIEDKDLFCLLRISTSLCKTIFMLNHPRLTTTLQVQLLEVEGFQDWVLDLPYEFCCGPKFLPVFLDLKIRHDAKKLFKLGAGFFKYLGSDKMDAKVRSIPEMTEFFTRVLPDLSTRNPRFLTRFMPRVARNRSDCLRMALSRIIDVLQSLQTIVPPAVFVQQVNLCVNTGSLIYGMCDSGIQAALNLERTRLSSLMSEQPAETYSLQRACHEYKVTYFPFEKTRRAIIAIRSLMDALNANPETDLSAHLRRFKNTWEKTQTVHTDDIVHTLLQSFGIEPSPGGEFKLESSQLQKLDLSGVETVKFVTRCYNDSDIWARVVNKPEYHLREVFVDLDPSPFPQLNVEGLLCYACERSEQEEYGLAFVEDLETTMKDFDIDSSSLVDDEEQEHYRSIPKELGFVRLNFCRGRRYCVGELGIAILLFRKGFITINEDNPAALLLEKTIRSRFNS